jgi:KaiC/GvpD/RAD55 family RecA-like ATPase
MTRTKKHGGLIKTTTGIQGFDVITGGGLPQGRTTLVMGGPGSGKTVFALQALIHGVLKGEPGILVTFQESPRQIVENAASFGLDLAHLEKDKLVILDARIRPNVLKSIELYLSGLLAGIRVVANEMSAKRVVFDSLDTLLSLLDDRMTERHELFRLRDWLLESGFTSLITVPAEGEDPLMSQHNGSMQFMADCVVNLRHDVSSPTAARSLRVLKYRGSGFAESEFPFLIGPAGLEVASTPKMRAASLISRENGHVDIQHEIGLAQNDFKARIKSLNRQLEIKQAEVDFLLQSKAKNKSKLLRGQTNGSLRKSVKSLRTRKGRNGALAKTLLATNHVAGQRRPA